MFSAICGSPLHVAFRDRSPVPLEVAGLFAFIGQPMPTPTVYTEELARTICDRLALDESLVSIATALDIDRTIIYDWARKNPEFEKMMRQAREDQAHTVVDKLNTIRERVMLTKDDPRYLEAPQARAAADIIKWEAGRRLPKVYGDKLELSGDANAPLQVIINKPA